MALPGVLSSGLAGQVNSPGSMVDKEMPGHSFMSAQGLWEGETLALTSLEQGLQPPASFPEQTG